MKFTLNKRWRWWLTGLALSLALVAKGYLDDQNHTSNAIVTATAPVRHTDSHHDANEAPPQAIALKQLHRTDKMADTADLFRSKSWYVPPPPVPPAPPPAPTAPPLPFTFMGKVQNPDGSQTLFLSDQNRVYLVHGGETLAKNYHVDGIEHGKLVLTYLPLNKKQFLNLAEAH